MVGAIIGAIVVGTLGAVGVLVLMRALERSEKDPRNRSQSFPDADCLFHNGDPVCQRATYEVSDRD